MQLCQDNSNLVYSCQEREKHYVCIAGSLCEQLQLFERLPPRHLVATLILGCAASIAQPYSKCAPQPPGCKITAFNSLLGAFSPAGVPLKGLRLLCGCCAVMVRELRAVCGVVTSWLVLLFQQCKISIRVMQATNHIPDQSQVPTPVPKIALGSLLLKVRQKENGLIAQRFVSLLLNWKQVTFQWNSEGSQDLHKTRNIFSLFWWTAWSMETGYCCFWCISSLLLCARDRATFAAQCLIFILHGSQCMPSCVSAQDKALLVRGMHMAQLFRI